MNPQAQNIDLHDVEREISGGFRWLRFRSGLERYFESDVNADRCRDMIRQNYIGMMLYHSFLFSDYSTVGDVYYLDLIFHFVIITPMTLAINFVLSRRPPVWVREGVEALGIVGLAASIAVVVSCSRLPDRDIVNFTQVLLILFLVVMQRLRILYAIAVFLAIQATYSFSMSIMDGLTFDRLVICNSVFVGIGLFSMTGAYNLEYESRMGYLLRLRDRFRSQQLETASLCDALTGIGNRRALDKALERLLGKAGTSRTAAILLLDIDHFKQFNDTNGHLQGDTCLRRVAGIIEGSLRGSDQVAYRFGGEEFLVLLEDTSLDDALTVAERIRSNVARAGIRRDPATMSVVTVSGGVCAGRIEHEAAMASLITAADNALYSAKRQGRDRVVSAKAPLSDEPLLAVA